eukprot:PhF_6_TR19568/c0_g1_i1/m.28529
MATTSSPMSPKHYDKYTYTSKRKNERDASSSPRAGATNKNSNHTTSTNTTAFAVDDTPAKLAPNTFGFSIAEDGVLMHRAVAPPRYLIKPAVAFGMGRALSLRETPGKDRGGVSSATAAWEKLKWVAGNDLDDEELAMLYWDSLHALLIHYGITDPVEVARIQIVWKKRQMHLPLEFTSLDSPMVLPPQRQHPKHQGISKPQETDLVKPTGGAKPTTPGRGASSNNGFGSGARRSATPPASSIGGGGGGVPLTPTSPRRALDRPLQPDYKKKLSWSNKPKVDSNRGSHPAVLH